MTRKTFQYFAFIELTDSDKIIGSIIIVGSEMYLRYTTVEAL